MRAIRSGASSGSRYGNRGGNDFGDSHFNYEDESQEAPRLTYSYGNNRGNYGSSSKSSFSSSSSKSTGASRPDTGSLDNIAKFFGGKGGSSKFGSSPRPAMDIPELTGAAGLKKGQKVRHAKYGEGTVLMREGEGEDAKLTVMFVRHGLKKLMEKFANLEKI